MLLFPRAKLFSQFVLHRPIFAGCALWQWLKQFPRGWSLGDKVAVGQSPHKIAFISEYSYKRRTAFSSGISFSSSHFVIPSSRDWI